MQVFPEHTAGLFLLLSAVVVSLLLVLPGADRAHAEDPAPAETVAARFAALLDAGETAAAWHEFTQIAKAIKNEEQWQRLHKTLRTTYGPLEKRTLRGVARQSRYPMLADGSYALVQFDTVFAHKPVAIETVVLAQEQDGRWRIHDYVIN